MGPATALPTVPTCSRAASRSHSPQPAIASPTIATTCRHTASGRVGHALTMAVRSGAIGVTHRQPPGRLAAVRAAFPAMCALLLLRISEKPLPNVFRDGQQPGVVDPFAVQTGHVVACVAHDGIHSNLVPTVAGNRLKAMP